MAIKNKDGSTFTLSKPNPVMSSQDLWNGRKVIYRNKFGILERLNYPKAIEEAPVEPKVEIPEEEVIAVSNKITCWCLPAHTEVSTDALYGDKFKRIKYGKKFVFEAVMKSQTDVSIVFFTNTKTVTENSIVYPRNNEKKWWRVVKTAPYEDVYQIYGTIADYHPSFAD